MKYDKTQKYRLLEKVGFKNYFHASTWEDYNRQFFDGLAPKYDSLNEVLSFGRHHAIKNDFIKKASIQPGSHILDLCTGSGDFAIKIARQRPDCKVTAVDASEKMLEIARERAKGLSNIIFLKENVLRLPFSDRSFDGIFVGFGLRNLDDLEKGLKEFLRVLKPKGFFANLDLGKPEGWFLNFIYEIYFGRVIPWLGKTFFHRGEFNSFSYLPESNRFFPTPAELETLLNEAGFAEIRSFKYMLGAITAQIALSPRA